MEGTFAGRVENRTKLWTGFEEQHYIKNIEHNRTFLYDVRGNAKPANFESIKIDVCDKCHGVWMDAGELAQISHKDKGGWFGKVFG